MKPGFILIAYRNLPLYKVPQFYDDRYHRCRQRCDREPGFLCCCLSMSHASPEALTMPRHGIEQAVGFPLLGGTPLVPAEAIKRNEHPMKCRWQFFQIFSGNWVMDLVWNRPGCRTRRLFPVPSTEKKATRRNEWHESKKYN